MTTWHAFNWLQTVAPLPPERRAVLVQLARVETPVGTHRVGALAVGYLRYGAGDKGSPYFVVGGYPTTFTVTHWNDCLGDHWEWPTGLTRQNDAPPTKTHAQLEFENQELRSALAHAIDEMDCWVMSKRELLEATAGEPANAPKKESP